jgi:hypothetical protein
MNLQPVEVNASEAHSLPHAEHDSQQHIKEFCSFILGKLGGDWMQTMINNLLVVIPPT